MEKDLVWKVKRLNELEGQDEKRVLFTTYKIIVAIYFTWLVAVFWKVFLRLKVVEENMPMVILITVVVISVGIVLYMRGKNGRLRESLEDGEEKIRLMSEIKEGIDKLPKKKYCGVQVISSGSKVVGVENNKGNSEYLHLKFKNEEYDKGEEDAYFKVKVVEDKYVDEPILEAIYLGESVRNIFPRGYYSAILKVNSIDELNKELGYG